VVAECIVPATHEVERLRNLARENQTAPADRRKVLRAAMKDELGFDPKDYGGTGFSENDLDGLVEAGVVSVRL
jgi:hypothetical protein